MVLYLSSITRSSCLKSLRVIINFFFRSFNLSLENSRRLLLIKLGEFQISLCSLKESLLFVELLSDFSGLSFKRLSILDLAIESLGDLVSERSICYSSDDLKKISKERTFVRFTLMTGLSLSN